MNWSEMSASWNDMSALVQTQWPKLGDVVVHEMNGERTALGRALQRQYGLSVEDAETAICQFEADVRRPGAVTPACHGSS
jgi:hypothetical protein